MYETIYCDLYTGCSEREALPRASTRHVILNKTHLKQVGPDFYFSLIFTLWSYAGNALWDQIKCGTWRVPIFLFHTKSTVIIISRLYNDAENLGTFWVNIFLEVEQVKTGIFRENNTVI